MKGIHISRGLDFAYDIHFVTETNSRRYNYNLTGYEIIIQIKQMGSEELDFDTALISTDKSALHNGLVSLTMTAEQTIQIPSTVQPSTYIIYAEKGDSRILIDEGPVTYSSLDIIGLGG